MGLTVAQKILKEHIVSGNIEKDAEISIRIDQTLTQDATGTMAYLQFEAMGIDKVKTEKSVAYVDHNTLQSGFENADDHKYIQTVCKKHGIYFSRPGNGICHQVHLERFAKPGKTLLGSDSHTPTAGGIGSFAMGAGGLDVAIAMGGGEYFIPNPKIVAIKLKGKLKNHVSAKDVILAVLEKLGVKGGVGKVLEYCGSGVKSLSVPERATITNMGAELGATTSIFPSDEVTYSFLKAQSRADDYVEILADPDAVYDMEIEIDLDKLCSKVALPHMPDNVKNVSEIVGKKVDQVCIGSCTNSSYLDLMRVAKILKGKTVNENVSLTISPGSKQVLNMLAQNGALADIIDAGARVLECACGPCIGMGQSPGTDAVSLRTFNRNFEGRSGTKSAGVYLVSPETAAISAIKGFVCDPAEIDVDLHIEMPGHFIVNDNMVDAPSDNPADVQVVRGPNIKPFPISKALSKALDGKAIIKVGDNITTDHIMPAGSKILPYRSNIPYLSQYCFEVCDKDFSKRAKENGGGIVVGGVNYGQGSSREHAALVPLYLGVRAVLVKSFARIHKANLINTGILPLTFKNEADYDKIDEMDELSLPDVLNEMKNGSEVTVVNKSKDYTFKAVLDISARAREILAAGGLLNYTKNNNK